MTLHFISPVKRTLMFSAITESDGYQAEIALFVSQLILTHG
jgi:hypothetical protein